MASLTAVVAQAATASTGIPAWVFFLTSGGVVALLGLLFRFFMLQSEKRLSAAGASKTEAEAQEIQDRVRVALAAEVETTLSLMREEIAEARAAEAEAVAEVKILIAQHARDRAEWKTERHDFQADIQAKDLRIAELEREVMELKEKIRVMEIRLGYEEGRRVEDGVTSDRVSALEARTSVEEARNDEIEARADRAQLKAEAQEQRNDDTPGHA